MKTGGLMITLLAAVLAAACAEKRPVLYPNAHLNGVGQEKAQADIDACIQTAKEGGAQNDRAGEVAKSTATGAAVGAAVGAATGAVLGSFGQGLGAGAAGGAAGGLVHGAIRSGEPDPVFRNFVDRCLKEKGYEPIGWK
jgi:hypothetical protein